MKLQAVEPRPIQFREVLDAADSLSYTMEDSVFVGLGVHVIFIAGAIGLVPVLPRSVRKPRTTAQDFGEYLFLANVRVVPVQLSGQINPVVALESRHSRVTRPFITNRYGPLGSPSAK